MTRALVLSSVFPSAARPTYGVFVWERVRRVAAHAEVVVVAPVPWFPFNAVFRGVRGRPVPFVEVQDGLAVYHPRYLGLPRYGRALDAIAYAARMLPLLKRLRRRFSFDLIDAHFSYPDGVAGVLLGGSSAVPP
jgi:hypothetical protein